MIEVKADRFNRSLDLLQRWLDTQFTQDALVVGSKTLAVKIKDRVQQTGTTADGGKFRGYSTKSMLVGRKSFRTQAAWERIYKQAKSAGKDSPLHWVTYKRDGQNYRLIVLPGGYKRLRDEEGLEVGYKNFTWDGFMWEGFKIKGGTKDTVFLGGINKDSQTKINRNTKREGRNIIAASQKETDELTRFANAVVQKKIKEFFK